MRVYSVWKITSRMKDVFMIIITEGIKVQIGDIGFKRITGVIFKLICLRMFIVYCLFMILFYLFIILFCPFFL